MTQKLQPVRGTHDLLPEDSRRFRFVIAQALKVAECYGYGEIATPIFEFSEVFHRTLGDTSDVVTKETYSFTDRGGESLTLRPEFTAGIARAFISNGLQDQLPLKFFAAGPAFRYERPQKGRMRQFHQIDAELLGVDSPLGDVESIAMAYHVLGELGLVEKVKLEINTLGDPESRQAYREALVTYFTIHEAALSEESKARLARNPLRILDSKDEGDRKIIANAPRMEQHLTQAARDYFAAVLEGLSALGIEASRNERLVRGLDYYNHTVFEFTTEMLGAQGTVLAGGRYDGLISMMGGAPTPGIGWAAGVERLVELIDFATHPEYPKPPRPISIIPLGEKAEKMAVVIAQALRLDEFVVDLAYKGNAGKRMKRADKIGSRVAVIIGDDEIAKQTAILKDLSKGTQEEVALANLTTALAPYNDRG
jgi:histidyl-tRNA synthetase